MRRSTTVIASLILLGVAEPARSQGRADEANTRYTADGVTVSVLADRSCTRPADLRTRAWKDQPTPERSGPLRGNLAIRFGPTLAILDANTARLAFYTAPRTNPTHAATVPLLKGAGPCVAAIGRAADPEGVRLEVVPAGPDGNPATSQARVVRFAGSGLVEITASASEDFHLTDCPMRFVIAPSLIGGDLVYDPTAEPTRDPTYLPDLNAIVGLIDGGDAMVTVCWPEGETRPRLRASGEGDARRFDRLTLDQVTETVYLAFQHHPDIWHTERPPRKYLERDNQIAWQRPFEANWIARLYLKPQDMHYPYYFQRRRYKVWGRSLRGWYIYPAWFDGDKTIVRFAKKYPPDGDLLIYHLERSKLGRTEAGTDLAPLDVMRLGLGRAEAGRLLDVAGIERRKDLRLFPAVCAMSDRIHDLFENGAEEEQRAIIERLADKIVVFIRVIRERAYEYEAYAEAMTEWLDAQAKDSPDLAGDFQAVRDECRTLIQKVDIVMPKESIPEVQSWADGIKALIDGPKKGRIGSCAETVTRFKILAGTQDDLVRSVCIETLRIMEQTAAAGTLSADHAALADEILAKTRQVLRKPTRWEPRRLMRISRDPDGDR